MPGTVVMLHNPFRPERDREVIAVAEPLTIRAWLGERGIDEFECPTICLRNGVPMLRGSWDETLIAEDDLVVFVPLPQGGGGGGKNPLRIVLMLALMVAALTIPGAQWGLALKVGTLGHALATAAITVVGTALVNVLIPPPKPSAITSNFGSAPAPSSTYSLQAQGNHARLAQPIPVVYGRHRVFPDLAATPWTEYDNNEQHLHQLHCIGQGQYDLEQVRIEDTPISSFEEIETELVAPGGAVTLFETDVVTAPEIAGQELIGVNDRETAVTTNDAGEEVTTVVGDGWIGPFIANPAGTEATGIGIDVVMPRGLYYANDDGSFSARTVDWEVEARAVDDEGEAAGEWLALASESVTAAENTPQRKSYRYTVTAGRYEVRVRRTNDKSGDARAGHEIRWAGLKTFLEDTPEFGAVTLLAVKMRATDNLSQRSARLVNVIVTRRLPVWDPETGWSAPQPTRSLAWALADAARATYGAGLADARIDLAALHALDQVWQSRGDRFDAVFDQGLTVWEALTRIARCGRALPFLQGGILRIARDAPRILPVALFGPRNIAKGSFRVQYVMPGEDTADAVTVTYFSERTWAPDEVVAALPDSDTEATDKPATVELFGCTGPEQAMREGLYMAAANRYRRRIMTFRTELEGLIPTYGDLIAITHDLPRWGQGGEVVEADGRKLVLSEPLEWDAGDDTATPPTHYLALRRRDGTLSGPWPVLPGDDARTVELNEDLDLEPYTGADEERTHFAFGPGEAWGLRARVLAVRPRGEQVEITAVGEDDRVHQADAVHEADQAA